MGDLSDFQRGEIVGVRLAGASTTKTVTVYPKRQFPELWRRTQIMDRRHQLRGTKIKWKYIEEDCV
jgi:hypothetical protein